MGVKISNLTEKSSVDGPDYFVLVDSVSEETRKATWENILTDSIDELAVTVIRAAGVALDSKIATEKAIRTALDYILSNANTSVGDPGSDGVLVSEQAVREAITAAETTLQANIDAVYSGAGFTVREAGSATNDVLATELAIRTAIDTQAGTKLLTNDDSSSAGAIALAIGESTSIGSLNLRVFEADVTISSSVSYISTGLTLPSYSLVLAVMTNNDTAVTVSGGAGTYSVGVYNGSGDPDRYGTPNNITQNGKLVSLARWADVTSYAAGEDWLETAGAGSQTVTIASTNGGTAVGTLDSGTIHVKIWYLEAKSLATT